MKPTNIIKTATFGALALLLPGCSKMWVHHTPPDVEAKKAWTDDVPTEMTDRFVNGTVDRFWAEPMYDQVRVPAQVDPNNVYYMPSHEALVEIRRERYQEVQFPGK